MAKSHFRIMAFRCLTPQNPVGGETHYVSRMQRSLFGKECWYKFYQDFSIEEGGNIVKIPNTFWDDGMLYDSDSVCVSVCSIVGENGSGKSSILDMMIRMFNNAAVALIGEHPMYAGAEHLHYIEHVCGEILYMQDQKLRKLHIEGHNVFIIDYIEADNIENRVINDTIIQYQCVKQKHEWLLSKGNEDVKLIPCNKRKLNELAEFLFYTIDFNYSLYAYNPFDYWEEATSPAKLDKIKPKQNYQKDAQLQIWLNGVFHKNDGYQAPLVVNPMRDNGNINAEKENKLAKERLLSMLFYKDQVLKQENGYSQYPFRIINKEHVIMALALSPLSDYEKQNKWTKDWMLSKGYFGQKSRLYTKFDEIKQLIIDYLNEWEAIDLNTKDADLALRYIIYKTLKIGLTYKKYNKIISNLRKADCSVELLRKHLEELFLDKTHITVKIRRTLMFLISHAYDDVKEQGCVCSLDYIEEASRGYIKELEAFRDIPNIAQRTVEDFLPPPIYNFEFHIIRKDNIRADGRYNTENLIPFWSLSSGERQIAYIISNFVYHLVNIDSVHTTELDQIAKLPLLKYKYVNAIFDEIELYFHPDLQRRFLFLLTSALRNIHLEHIEGINILMVTHSPFVLSDLPKSNVLALGQEEESIGETFCANIHEMLGQSFFMEYSMGQIAQEQVEEIFRVYRECLLEQRKQIEDTDWKRYKYVASKVADEYLHKTLERALCELQKRRRAQQ